MQDFILTLLFNIHGIGAASGIVYHNDAVYLVSDNSNYLYQYDMAKRQLQKTSLLESTVYENIPKKQKQDFETLVLDDDRLYVFGSGSTENRNKLVVVNLKRPKEKPAQIDLSALYEAMREKSGITAGEFNIEGAVFNKHWYFFQRGNGPAGRNGVFSVAGNIVANQFTIDYKEVRLPECNGVAATFTDAIAIEDKFYFLGTSEKSNSVYHDGEILGSLIGRLNPETMEIEFTQKISDTHKFEGLALFKREGQSVSFLLCEDNDKASKDSAIYQLTLQR